MCTILRKKLARTKPVEVVKLLHLLCGGNCDQEVPRQDLVATLLLLKSLGLESFMNRCLKSLLHMKKRIM